MVDITKHVAVIIDGKISPGFKNTNTQVVKSLDGYQRVNARIINSTKQMTNATYKFNAALLGTMFFGMGIQRVFSSMLGPAAEVFGIFDLWGTTMQVVFLPVMTSIFDVFLPFVTMLMNLPEPVKMLIGVLVSLAALFGTILFIVSSVALGLGALAFAGVGLGTIIGITATVFTVLIGVFAIIKGVIDVIKGKWEGLGMILIGIGAILLFFIGWWALIPIAIGATVYLIIKHWDKIKTFFKNTWDWIIGVFKWAIDLLVKWFSNDPIIGFIIKNWGTIVSFFRNLWEGVKNVFSTVWSAIWGVLKGYINLMIDGFNLLIKGMNKLKLDVPDWVPGFGGKTIGFSIPEIPKLAEGGIVNRPTLAMIGERGPEAVVPLNKGLNGITINQNISITGGLKEEVERMIRDNNRNLVDDIRRLTGIRG